jgi:hypothetical protein
MHILVFICYVINIFSLFEYAQRKGNYIVFTRFHKFSNTKNNYIFFLIRNLGFTPKDGERRGATAKDELRVEAFVFAEDSNSLSIYL